MSQKACVNTHCLLAQVVDRAFGTDCTFVLQNLPVCVVDPNSAYVPDLLSFGQLGRFTPSYLPVGINIHYSLELTLRTCTGARPDTGPLLRKAYPCPLWQGGLRSYFRTLCSWGLLREILSCSRVGRSPGHVGQSCEW